jgi:hypothetical protein
MWKKKLKDFSIKIEKTKPNKRMFFISPQNFILNPKLISNKGRDGSVRNPP